jgi:ferredoxin
VHLLLSERIGDLGAGELRETLSGDYVSLASLALAHREAFVLQSSLGRVADLTEGLASMAESRGPAVAVVACPDWESPVPPWDQLAAAGYGRFAPCFRYEAQRGDSYAERFVSGDNPQPLEMWPRLTFEHLDEHGAEQALPERFTFAHMAALAPAYREHLALIPAEAWSEDQVQVGEYLDLPRERRRRSLPFVWVLDAAGELARAVLTRELAFAALGRARAWRVLQELGGTDNEYANRAAERARKAAEAEAEQRIAELRSAHAEQLEQAGERAVSQAMHRLAASLLSSDVGRAAAEAAPSEVAAEQESAAEVPPPSPAAAAAPREPDEADDASFDDPYIDTPLCTTCNECTNINPRLFAYDENRQAFIRDAGAGTFDELVRAAEKCPARCIHPGVPRADDATASDDLIARAKAFD